LTKVETASSGDAPATKTEFDYDLMGRVSKHRQWIGSQEYDLEYGYNLAGQLISEKYPSGRIVTNSFDANGRLSGIEDGSRTYLSSLQYQGNGGSLSSMSFGNGTAQTFTLNDRMQMTGQELKKGSETLQKYNYGYGQIDGLGNLDATKNNGQLSKIESYIGSSKQWTQKFAYDSLGRLSQSAEYKGTDSSLTYKQVFDFDRFGNMYRKAANNATTGQANPLAYTPIEDSDVSKSTNRFATNTTYDEAGQVTTDNKFRTMGFGYDANGRMVKATKTSVPDALSVYDAAGMRVAVSGMGFVPLKS
jgi:YD repeat-containing protein